MIVKGSLSVVKWNILVWDLLVIPKSFDRFALEVSFDCIPTWKRFFFINTLTYTSSPHLNQSIHSKFL